MFSVRHEGNIKGHAPEPASGDTSDCLPAALSSVGHAKEEAPAKEGDLRNANGRKKAQKAQRGQPQSNRRCRRPAGTGRRNVKGMIVRGMILKTLIPIPLTTIPLTMDFSRKMTDQESSRICAMLTDCCPEAALAIAICRNHSILRSSFSAERNEGNENKGLLPADSRRWTQILAPSCLSASICVNLRAIQDFFCGL